MKSRKKIVVLTGPTASGKSDLGISLAKEFDSIIINSDSKQVYEELQIGTARPQPDSIVGDSWYVEGVNHQLYGYVSIYEPYDVAQYKIDAERIIENNLSQNIILLGGTGLYIDSVIKGYFSSSSIANQSTIERAVLESLDLESLRTLINPEVLELLNNSDYNNPYRLIRIIERGGLPSKTEQYDYLYLVLDHDREILKAKAKVRITEMLANGLIDEAESIRSLIEMGDSRSNIIGYKEFRGYFEGELNIEDVQELIINHTNQYIKRQMTWFRNRDDAIMIHGLDEARDQISNFLTTRS